jgi:hypothetical protein
MLVVYSSTVARGILTRPQVGDFEVATGAEATEVQKGETMEWLVEDRNTFILKRVRSRRSFLKKQQPP